MTNKVLVAEMTKVKFMYNGIKIDGKLFCGHWSNGPWVSGNEGMITFYYKGYDQMPNIGVEVQNDTNIQTDYFESDRLRFMPNSQFYLQAVNAYQMHKEKADKRHQAYLVRNRVAI